MIPITLSAAIDALCIPHALNEAKECEGANIDDIGEFFHQHACWSQHPYVVGMGLAYQTDKDGRTLPVIRVYITDSSSNFASNSIPCGIDIPNFGNVKTEIIQGSVPYLQNRIRQSIRLGPAASISHVNHQPGTLCAKVVSRWGELVGKSFLLSCNHVLYPRFHEEKMDIVSPAANSNGLITSRHKIIAKALGGAHAEFKPFGLNSVDAGIAKMVSSLTANFSNAVLNSGYSINGIADDIAPGTPVIMFGAASKRRRLGKVKDVSYRGKFKYKPSESASREVSFYDVVQCDYKSDGGDSGAPVFIAGTRKLAGMHFAGGGGYGYFCKAKKIFRKLDIRLPF